MVKIKRGGEDYIYPRFFVAMFLWLLLHPNMCWLIRRHQLPDCSLTFRINLNQHVLIRTKENVV